MPYTLNGVGTRYYGRRNVSALDANCPFCGRFVRLSSYDTREFFCFVYIPLIPLRKFRIQSDCPACSRHHRFPLAQFREEMETTLAPLRSAVERNPRDPEARLSLLHALLGFQMLTEADTAAREALAAIPGHGRISQVAADLAVFRGDLAGATPLYRQAAATEPGDIEIRLDLGQHLARLGQHEEAVRELEEARRLDSSDIRTLYSLGESYAQLQRWGEALPQYERMIALSPQLAQDREILRRIKECKEALNYPLSEAERKAGRRWWPFDGRQKQPRQAWTGQTDWGRVMALLAVLLVVGAAGAAGLAWWRQQHVQVFFDNGLAEPVEVALDGQPFAIPADQRVERTLAPGKHQVVVNGDRGEIERYEPNVPEQGLVDALLEPWFFVYNVAEARVYRRETLGYAEKAEDSTYEEKLIALQRFFPQTGVDYIFQEAPQQIESDAHGVEKRVAFNVAADLDLEGFAVRRFSAGDTRQAEQALRKVIGIEPCRSSARESLVNVVAMENRPDKPKAEAGAWIAACPDQEVLAHRAYQDVAKSMGHLSDLLREYQARRDEHPEAAANHYLYGRLLDDPDATMSAYQEAIRLDPQLSWAHAALGSVLLALERDADAMASFQRALDIPGHDPNLVTAYALAAIGAGSPDAADAAIRSRKEEEPEDFLWRPRWLLALANGRHKDAEKMLAKRSRSEPDSPDVWVLEVQLLRHGGRSDKVMKELDRAAQHPGAEYPAALIRLEEMLAQGQYREAAELVDSEEQLGEPLYRLYGAAAFLLAGDRSAAEERLGKLIAGVGEELAEQDARSLTTMAEALREPVPAEQVLRDARSSGFPMLAHAYFILGVRATAAGDAVAARGFFLKSQQRALDFELPYFAARALAGAPAAPTVPAG
ncbi:MAG TPA: tetratricopeptide repeat protein [Thermoanaerobaculia bacterium]